MPGVSGPPAGHAQLLLQLPHLLLRLQPVQGLSHHNKYFCILMPNILSWRSAKFVEYFATNGCLVVTILTTIQ